MRVGDQSELHTFSASALTIVLTHAVVGLQELVEELMALRGKVEEMRSVSVARQKRSLFIPLSYKGREEEGMEEEEKSEEENRKEEEEKIREGREK